MNLLGLSPRELFRRIAFGVMVYFAVAWVVATWWPGKYALGPIVMSIRSPRHPAIYCGIAAVIWIVSQERVYRRLRGHG